MHELSLAQAVWQQVLDEMQRRPGSCLLAVNVVVGALSGADPESLDFAMQLVAADSDWPGAKVHIRGEPLALRCRACGHAFETRKFELACPKCASLDVEVTGGRDLRLESLEVQEVDA